MLDITLKELLMGTIALGLLVAVVLSVVYYVLLMLLFAIKMRQASASYYFAKRFGESANETRQRVKHHLLKHGMSMREVAECMNSWQELKEKESQHDKEAE